MATTPVKKRAAGSAGKKPAAAAKIDLFRERKVYFTAAPAPEVVTFKAMKFLTIEGTGAPDSPAFQQAVGAMYAVAFTLKMQQKQAGHDYKVSTLEGLWWADYPPSALADPDALWTAPRETWKWKLLIMVPDFITKSDVRQAAASLAAKKGEPRIADVTLERFAEGKSVQILHVGPYALEPASIVKMRDLMAREHLQPRGRHHEIYLSDPRRTKPEKIRTILRQPVAQA